MFDPLRGHLTSKGSMEDIFSYPHQYYIFNTPAPCKLRWEGKVRELYPLSRGWCAHVSDVTRTCSFRSSSRRLVNTTLGLSKTTAAIPSLSPSPSPAFLSSRTRPSRVVQSTG